MLAPREKSGNSDESLVIYSLYEIKLPRHRPDASRENMKTRKVSVLCPLLGRLEAIAESEGLSVEELVDHVLRSYEEQYEFDEEDEAEDSSDDEDETSDDNESPGEDAEQESG